MSHLQVLIDADMFAFEIASSCEVETHWGDDIWTLHSDTTEATQKLDATISDILLKAFKAMKFEGDYEVIMCLSDRDNPCFRKDIYPLYKYNRVGLRKPVCYNPLVEYIKENYTTIIYPRLEADDVIGIYATTPNTKSLIISADKDMQSIPETHIYNHRKEELTKTTYLSAMKFHLKQTLIGDTCDNYGGCKSIGEVRANKIVEDEPSWENVVKTFIKNGHTEQEALTQARLAFILQYDYYNKETGDVELWYATI